MNIKNPLHPRPALVLLILGLLLPALLAAPSRTWALTAEEESELGKEFLTTVRQHFEFIEDEFAQQYIEDLGKCLVGFMEDKLFPLHFYILKDASRNAFAAPGGHIFVFSGLVQALENVDQLAAVMTHEMAHVSARHLAQRISQSKKIGLATLAGILIGALIGGPVAEAIITGSVAAGIQTQLHYSRNDERQADQLGFKYMQASGFSPDALIGALTVIQQDNWLGTDKIPAYLQTHPTGPERMSNLDSLLKKYQSKAQESQAAEFRALFPFFQASVMIGTSDRKHVERTFRTELETHPSSPSAHFGLGLLYKDAGEYGAAAEHLREALEEKPDFVPILLSLGETYQRDGKNQQAITVLEKVLEKNAGNEPALYHLALCYESLENYEKAIRLFERLAAYKPVRDEVYYHLGLCFGRLDRLGYAHYNFGIYFKKKGQQEEARFHFNKAESLAGDDAELKRKIQEHAQGSG